MKIGYARTSTLDQEASFENQQRILKDAGCDKVFAEQVSAVASTRPQLERAIEFCREGDTLVVHRLSRLARSVADAVAIKQRLEAKDVGLQLMDLGLDTGTPTGKLMFNIVASIAEFERDLMLERQRVGIEKAKAEGRYKGRAPTARAKAEEVRRLKANGLSGAAIANQLGISKRSVWSMLSAKSFSDDKI